MSALSRTEGWSHYKQKWLPSMQYSLLATSLTSKQCKVIEQQSNHVYLNAVGFPKSFPGEMVTAPRTAGGVGFRSLMVEQGSFHTVKTLISHGRKDSGQLSLTLNIAYRWYHLYTGLRYHPFQHGQTSVSYVPQGWIKATQDFLAASDLSVHWQTMQQLPPRRLQDRCLMADANKKTYTKGRLNHINNCRLYLRVEYLSDVCNQAGTHILTEATEWHNPRTISKPTKQFPKQACPGKKQWAIFRKFLRTT